MRFDYIDNRDTLATAGHRRIASLSVRHLGTTISEAIIQMSIDEHPGIGISLWTLSDNYDGAISRFHDTCATHDWAALSPRYTNYTTDCSRSHSACTAHSDLCFELYDRTKRCSMFTVH